MVTKKMTEDEREPLSGDPVDESASENSDFISRAELEQILAKRDKQHEEEIAAMRAVMPQAMVAAHAGGPGFDNHQVSWSLAEQEAAARGEVLDHWKF